MMPFIRHLCALLLFAAAGSGGEASAHGDKHGPLLVAEDGRDTGTCTDETSPCRSLGYALSVAGKGSEIRVAEGTYPIENAEDLFHVISGMVEVSGGYARSNGRFGERSGVSILTGVPPQFRPLLNGLGFHVVSDRKRIEHEKSAQADKLVDLHRKLKTGATAGPCDDGSTGELACDSIDLLAHFSFAEVSADPASATDVWGFVDLNTGREYALVGYNIGTAIIDITDPANPAEVGFVAGKPAGWRDIKVYQFFDASAARWRAYAYVTTDGSTDGLFVIDMSGLPHAIRKLDFQSDFSAAHNVYITNTDFGTGLSLTGEAPLLVIAGSNLGGGQFRAYSLADPAAPQFIGGAPGATDYMHDAASVIITDARKDTQCVNAGAWCEILFDFNENSVDVWDITDPADPQRLKQTPYDNASYVHSGWATEDKQYLLVHDELDEQHRGLNTTVRAFSIGDLREPVLIGAWEGDTRAIDHNGYVRGNRYYLSNYSRGLTVLDITDPAAPSTAGSLDTYPFSDNSSFTGAWGTYPFFFSKTVAVSDIDSGLYLARDRSVEVPQGRFSFSARSYAEEEGRSAQLVVRRDGGTMGDVAVEVETIGATAGANDYTPGSRTLAWSAGDASPRTVDLPLANDGTAEGLERFLVRLVNPSGGASLGDVDVASVYVADPAAAPAVGFFAERIEVPERGFSTAVVVLQRRGTAAGPASVSFALSGGDATPGADFAGETDGTVTWEPGDGEPKNLLFHISDDDSAEGTEFFKIALSSQNVTIDGSAEITVDIIDSGGADPSPDPVGGDTGGGGSGGGNGLGLLLLLSFAMLIHRTARLRNPA